METTEPMKFSDSTELSPEILKAVAKMGFQEMTPVQQQTLPLMMEGRDVIAIAPTGTGKTCAFGIPMLEYVNLNDRRVQELVLAPTRELSLQITDELRALAQLHSRRAHRLPVRRSAYRQAAQAAAAECPRSWWLLPADCWTT